MQKKRNINVFLYTFLSLALFSVFFFSNFSKLKAQTSSTILCTNSRINQYIILNSQYTCPNDFNLSPNDFDFTNYDPVSDISLYLNGVNGNNTNTQSGGNTVNITPTTQANLQNNTQPVIQDQNFIIEPDPSLASGPFLNLDPTDYPYCVSLSSDLSYGIKDTQTKGDVSALQAYLTDRGFLETGATGFYGRSTELAVKRFEYRNQIEVNGIVRRDFRDILKELTCQKYQKITYVDKPISPSKKNSYVSTIKNTAIPTTKISAPAPVKKTVIPATNANSVKSTSNYVSITPAPTNPNLISGPTLDNTKLSSPYGALSLSNRNNLYFTFNTNSPTPTICININSIDCSLPANNIVIKEGVNGNLYEAINISGKWSLTIYSNSTWGGVGSRANIYLKDSVTSNIISIYTISVSN
jgi:peptidoglycan hydrolase-like protein with peptidoglycan-binding domain